MNENTTEWPAAARQPEITLSEARGAVYELTRELSVRSNYYPRAIEEGKLSQFAADRQNAGMRSALRICRDKLNELDQQTDLFSS